MPGGVPQRNGNVALSVGARENDDRGFHGADSGEAPPSLAQNRDGARSGGVV
jgi:hypothetical protein